MKNKRFLSWVAALLFLTACSTEANIQQILGTSVQAPVFVDCRPVSSREILFSFSGPVRVVSLNFDTSLEIESIEEGSEVSVVLASSPTEGRRITADILVEDSNRNSLNVIVPFRSRNDRMPLLLFNELRTEYSKPRVEFVEFIAQGPGNLGALRLFIASHSLSKPIYEFPSAEVKAGEYIVLHLRTIEEDCVDETGTDLALSGGADAQPDARDLWLPGSTKLLRKTDALWLMDQDDRILDAVLLCENPQEWGKNNSAAAAELLGRQGAWLSKSGGALGPEDAITTAGTTATRTICRDESLPPATGSGNWYICAASSATPGKVNNPKRYVP